jgi:hypothetical protein
VQPLDCSHIGTFPWSFSISDRNGNTTTCDITVTVLDKRAPTAVCQNATIYLQDDGKAYLDPTDLDGGSSDNCGIASYSVDIDVFGCNQAGSNPVTLTVTDASGNSSSCTATVTVEGSASSSIDWQLAPNARIWPPDYTYQTFSIADMITEISDGCGGTIGPDNVWIDQVTSDEAEDDPSAYDGSTLDDIVISPDCRSVQLRKERMSNGNGRVYVITLATQSTSGNISYADYEASVPRWPWGWYSTAVKDATRYAASCSPTSSSAVVASPTEMQQTVQLLRVDPEKTGIELSVYPNPFQSELTIQFSIPKAGQASLQAFNLQGQLIRHLHHGFLEAGEHQWQWSGESDSGQALPSGIYLIQLRVKSEVINKKILLQRL